MGNRRHRYEPAKNALLESIRLSVSRAGMKAAMHRERQYSAN